ncbi:MAG: livK [Frankiales bacterium]|nr:livK [Frankiales bacterium]
MSLTKRWTVATSVAVVAGAILTGCGGGGSTSSSASSSGSSSGSSSSGTTYVLGVDDVLSGPLAGYGQSFLTSAKAAVAYINSKGGVNGHKFQLETADSAAAGQNAGAAAQQLISAKNASAILGFTLSDDCTAVSTLATTRKVPIICTSTPSALLSPVKKFVFASNDVEVQEVPGMVKFAQDTLHLKSGTKFAIIDSSPTGVQLWAKSLQSALENVGFQMVTHQTIPVTAVNGSTQISQVVSAKPDVVFAEPVASQYQPLVQALRAAGNQAPIVAAHNGANYVGVSTIKDPGLYDVTPTEFVTDTNPTGSGAQLYAAAMSGIGQGTAAGMNGVIGTAGFLGTYATAQAVGKCGDSCTGDQLAAQMEKVKLSLPGLVSGDYGWRSSLHQPYQKYFIYHWDASAQKTVPAASAVPFGDLSQ